MSKERIIQGIKERIDAEYRKYKDLEELDWSLIAAGKIFHSYNVTLQESKKISLRIKFKKSHMSRYANTVSFSKYIKDGVLFLQNFEDQIVFTLESMEEFPEIIGYFNLDEIESITFK